MERVSEVENVKWRVGASCFRMSKSEGGLLSWDIDLPGGIRRICKEGGILFSLDGVERRGEYEILSGDETSVMMQFVPVSGEACGLVVEYKFQELGMEVMLEFENRGEKPVMWFGGVVFEFSVPWHAGLSWGDYQVNIPAKNVIYKGFSGQVARKRDVSEFISLDDPLLDGEYTRFKNNCMTLGAKGGEENIEVGIGCERVPSALSMVRVERKVEDLVIRVEVGRGLLEMKERQRGICSVLPASKESFTVFLNLL